MPDILYETVDYIKYIFDNLGIYAMIVILIWKMIIEINSEKNQYEEKLSFISKTLNHFNKAFKNEIIKLNLYIDFAVTIIIFVLIYFVFGSPSIFGDNVPMESPLSYVNILAVALLGCFLICVLYELLAPRFNKKKR